MLGGRVCIGKIIAHEFYYSYIAFSLDMGSNKPNGDAISRLLVHMTKLEASAVCDIGSEIEIRIVNEARGVIFYGDDEPRAQNLEKVWSNIVSRILCRLDENVIRRIW